MSGSTARDTRGSINPWLILGLLVLALLWLGPLPELSRASFSWHMLLHLGVMVVAAPLIAIGLQRSRWGFDRFSPGLGWAVAASVAEMIIVWGWHAPILHAAAHHAWVFSLQQISFLGAGLLVWMTGFSGRAYDNAGAGAVAMMLAFMHMSMLGVLLALAPSLLYGHGMEAGAFFGLTPLQDQRLGGVLMAIGGGFPYLFGAAFLVYRFLSGARDRASGTGTHKENSVQG